MTVVVSSNVVMKRVGSLEEEEDKDDGVGLMSVDEVRVAGT